MSQSFDHVICIGGEAGQGMQTLGLTLTTALLHMGYHVSTLQSYQSRIRGGHNYFQIRVASQPIYSMRQGIDILIALDKPTLAHHCEQLSAEGLIIYDETKIKADDLCGRPLVIHAERLYEPIKSLDVLTNSLYLGMLANLLACPVDPIKSLFDKALAKKGDTIIKQNKEAFDAGYDFVAQSEWQGKYQTAPPAEPQPSMVLHGNQAIALGAMAAGCKFYAAYPMTPGTSIFETVANHMDDSGMIVEQAEDEIAALNMVLGASYGGVRAMTGTSGGGFALMVEALSLAGIIECPAVIANAQRPGPATGLPTRTEQGDLEFVIHAGHGEFPLAVLTPGDHQTCFDLTTHAFNLADRYQIPVIILTDQYLADWFSNVTPFDPAQVTIDRGKVVTPTNHYQRYQLTEDGISPRAYPGKGPDVVIVDSDEHTEDGHLTEDLAIRVKMNDKRLKKLESLKQEMIIPTVYGQSDEVGLICWGSSYGACRDAVESLQAEGVGISLIHFTQCWPLNEDKISGLLAGYKTLVSVEGNATGQLARLIRAATSIRIDHQILRYDGLPFYCDELKDEIKKVMAKHD